MLVRFFAQSQQKHALPDPEHRRTRIRTKQRDLCMTHKDCNLIDDNRTAVPTAFYNTRYVRVQQRRRAVFVNTQRSTKPEQASRYTVTEKYGNGQSRPHLEMHCATQSYRCTSTHNSQPCHAQRNSSAGVLVSANIKVRRN